MLSAGFWYVLGYLHHPFLWDYFALGMAVRLTVSVLM